MMETIVPVVSERTKSIKCREAVIRGGDTW